MSLALSHCLCISWCRSHWLCVSQELHVELTEAAADCVNESAEIKLKNDKISQLKEKLSNVQQTTNAQQSESEQSRLMLKKEIEQLQQVCWLPCAVCWLLWCGAVCCVVCAGMWWWCGVV